MQSKLAKYLAALAFAGVAAAQAAAPAQPQGVITAKEFLNISGTAVANLEASPKFPNNPDIVAYPPVFEWPANLDDPTQPPPGNVKADYGVQILGYFYPEVSGNHQFYISADDQAYLYLSTDDDPSKKVRIAQEPQWNGVRDYLGTARRPVDAVTGLAANVSAPINLVANRPYYIEAVMKEGGGGDNLSVAAVQEGFTPDLPIMGARLSTIDKTSGPVSIATQPASATAVEGAPVTLRVVAQGTPPYDYQWLRNGQPIEGATTESYSIAAATAADNNAKYSVRITNNGGANTVTSSEATLTVTSDTTAPTIVSARGNRELNQVTVVFSEPVSQATATATGNYSLSPSVAVTGATLVNPTTVRLTTAGQTQGANYTLTVNGVKDVSVAGNTIAANSAAQFRAWLRAKGFLTAEFYTGIGSVNLQSLLDDPDYQANQPDEIRYLGVFSTPNGYGDNYGIRVTGWLVPEVSGDYDFFVRADDQAALFINTEGEALPDASDPFTAIAAETSGCCEAFKEPDGFSTETTLAPVTLQAGRKYGVVFLMKEGGGGDWAEVAWRRVGDTTAASALRPMSGDLFESWVDPTGANIQVTTPPANVTIQEDRTHTFTVAETHSGNSVAYQWLKNGQPIAGATGLSYTTPLLALADNSTKYSLRIRVPGAETITSEATLTVVPDTFAPTVVGAGAVRHGSNWEVTVLMDEKLGGTPAISNFTIPGVTFTSITLVTNASGLNNPQSGVVLTTTGLTAGQSYTISVNGLRDLKNNAMTQASTATFVASGLTFAAIGNDNDWSDPAVVAVSTNEYHLVSGGQSFWGSTDDVTFLYEEVTGDFDKVVKVVYQDPSSQWARAGLTVREAVNEGAYPAEEAARYQNAHANPAIMYTGGPANNGYESNRRGTTGGATTGGGGSGGTTYPNTWIRLKREGSIITSWRSADGVSWTQYNSTDFATFEQATPLNAKMYVGLVYGPEAGNVPEDSGLRASWAAVFQNYGNFVAAPANGPVSITQAANGELTISWTGAGTLESATALNGTWTAVSGVTGTSYTTTATGGARFFRVRRQ